MSSNWTQNVGVSLDLKSPPVITNGPQSLYTEALFQNDFFFFFTTILLAYKLCPAHIKFFIIANSLNKRMKGKRKESNKESIEIAVLELSID